MQITLTDKKSTQNMVGHLKSLGLPIFALADMMMVGRKLVYSWLDDGVEANSKNYDRLEIIYTLLSGEQEGSLRFFHRFWNRKIIDNLCFKDIVTAQDIDLVLARNALDILRPAVIRSLSQNSQRNEKSSPASSLTLNLIAGSRF